MTTDELERHLRGSLREMLDRELGPHPAWTESPAARRAAELDRSRRRWPLRMLAVAAVIGAAAAGAVLLAGAPKEPAENPVLLARGSVVLKDWGPVEFEATRADSNVTGRLTVGLEDGTPADPDKGFVGVDFQCGRTTDDGLVAIGGYSTDGAGLTFRVHEKGTLFALVFRRGSPIAMQLWAGTLVNMPSTQTTDCLAYLDAWLPEARLGVPEPREVRRTVELGP